jgi:hypothetical protein
VTRFCSKLLANTSGRTVTFAIAALVLGGDGSRFSTPGFGPPGTETCPRYLVLCIDLQAREGGPKNDSRPQPRVNPQAATIKAFLDRVDDYLTLQKTAADGLPPLAPTDDPSKMDARQRALAARIRLARPNAKPGDVFGDVATIVRDAIQQDASNRPVRDQRAAMGEVPPRDPPRVNAGYPEKSPLATVPPLLLAKLPRLPEGVEYRFMGRDLVLRDVHANLIVDFVDGAAAPIKK